jgi:hypothetical protein
LKPNGLHGVISQKMILFKIYLVQIKMPAGLSSSSRAMQVVIGIPCRFSLLCGSVLFLHTKQLT